MTIHLPLNTTLPEIRRILEQIQKDRPVSNQPVQTTPNGGGGSTGGGSGTVGPQGPIGATGAAGADGVANLDLIVTTFTESEDIVMNGTDVVTDTWGLAVTDTHTDYDIVEDELGAIITAE